MTLKGLSIPLRATAAGRSAISVGDDHASKIIEVALSDCENNNAFQQDDGLGNVAFEISDDVFKGRIRVRLTKLFRELETALLYRLEPETIAWEDGEGETTLTFSYTNLESDDVKDFRKTFKGGT